MNGDSKFCTACGKQLPAIAQFCAGCGSAQAPVPAPPAAGGTPATIPSGRRRSSRYLAFAGIVGVMLLFAASVSFAAVEQFLGDPGATAEYYPDDTHALASVDFIQLRDQDRIQRFVDAMDSAFRDVDLDWEFDFEELRVEDVEIDVDDDVIPWIGRSASVGVFDAVGDEGYSTELGDMGPMSVLATVVVRDRDGAFAFSDSFLDDLAESSNEDLDTTSVDGWDGWTLGSRRDESLTWIVTDEAILVATSPEAIELALDSNSSGENLSSSPSYAPVVDAAPSSPLGVLYVSGETVADEFRRAIRSLDVDILEEVGDELDRILGYGGSVSLRDDGLLATFTVVDDGSGEEPRELVASSDIAARLPEATLAFGTFEIPLDAGSDAADELRSTDRDLYEEIVFEAEREVGIDPFDEILPYIGGPVTFAVVDSPGSIDPSLDVDIGGFVSIGITDSRAMDDAVDDVVAYIERNDIDVDRDGDLYLFSDRYGDGEVAFTLTESEMVLGGPVNVVEDWVSATGRSLADSDVYSQVASALGMPVTLFVDVIGIAELGDLDGSAEDTVEVFPAFGVGYESSPQVETVAVFVAVNY